MAGPFLSAATPAAPIALALMHAGIAAVLVPGLHPAPSALPTASPLLERRPQPHDPDGGGCLPRRARARKGKG